MLAVREGHLSPLSLKRPSPVLHKSEPTEKSDETPESISVQVQRAFDRNVRVLGCIPETDVEKNSEMEPFLRKAIRLRVPSVELGTAAAQFLQDRNVGSVAEWRDRMYLWDQAKDIPVDVRMATPFQRGNVCEDPERCEAIAQKGGDPSEIICPQCPVSTACRERGYLSQFSTFQTTHAQILGNFRLFLDPQYAESVEKLPEVLDGTQPLCIINVKRENNLFLRCKLLRSTLKEWVVNWQRQCLRELCDSTTECGRNQRQIPR